MDLLDNEFPGFYFKTHGGLFQVVGLPDIIGVHRGRFIAIEVKVPGEEPSKVQLRKLQRLGWAGAIAFWATSDTEVRKKLKRGFKGWKN